MHRRQFSRQGRRRDECDRRDCISGADGKSDADIGDRHPDHIVCPDRDRRYPDGYRQSEMMNGPDQESGHRHRHPRRIGSDITLDKPEFLWIRKQKYLSPFAKGEAEGERDL